MIYPDAPSDWQELEARVLQVLLEVGCKAERARTIDTARGTVEVDVYALDDSRNPQQVMLFECKYWNRLVSKNTIHGLRTVLSDAGANVGYVISKRGFQSGAVEAAVNSNLILLTWNEFQEHFYDRWISTVSNHLMFLADRIYELTASDENDKFYNRLAYDAQKTIDEGAYAQLDALNSKYVAYSLISSLIGAAGPVVFIKGRLAPDLESGEQLVHRDSQRATVDALLEAAPIAYREYVDFLLVHTDGNCGDVRLFDMSHRERMKSLPKKEVENEYGGPRWISNWNHSNERWHFKASKTHFHRPLDAIKDVQSFLAETEEVTIEITFRSDGSVDDFDVSFREFRGLPH